MDHLERHHPGSCHHSCIYSQEKNDLPCDPEQYRDRLSHLAIKMNTKASPWVAMQIYLERSNLTRRTTWNVVHYINQCEFGKKALAATDELVFKMIECRADCIQHMYIRILQDTKPCPMFPCHYNTTHANTDIFVYTHLFCLLFFFDTDAGVNMQKNCIQALILCFCFFFYTSTYF